MGEPFPAWLWLALPLLVAAGAAMVTAAVMRSRGETALARQRQDLAEARALLLTQHRAMEERVRACEQAARTQALDEFLADVHVEERHFVQPAGVPQQTKLVVQERVCFRHIPLSSWTERELPGSAMLLPAPPLSARSEIPAERVHPARPAEKARQLPPVRGSEAEQNCKADAARRNAPISFNAPAHIGTAPGRQPMAPRRLPQEAQH